MRTHFKFLPKITKNDSVEKNARQRDLLSGVNVRKVIAITGVYVVK